jgi:hypothetical protein
MMILPRQARDTHSPRESTEKRVPFLLQEATERPFIAFDTKTLGETARNNGAVLRIAQ